MRDEVFQVMILWRIPGDAEERTTFFEVHADGISSAKSQGRLAWLDGHKDGAQYLGCHAERLRAAE